MIKAVYVYVWMLATMPKAEAWSLSLGGCTFQNDASNVLIRSGSCSGAEGFTASLDLQNMNPKIESLSAGVFADMGGLT